MGRVGTLERIDAAHEPPLAQNLHPFPPQLASAKEAVMGRGASGWMVWAGIALILLTGLVHLVEAPASFSKAAYVGILFLLNSAGAGLTALGIYRGGKEIGWGLGLLIAVGSLISYLISRTIGLPGLEIEPWGGPASITALVAEALFLLLALRVLTLPDGTLPHGLSTPTEEHSPAE